MKISLLPPEELEAAGWDVLLQSAGLATVFSSPAFYTHHEVSRNPQFLLVTDDNGKPVGGMVFGRSGNTVVSPVGASYGGFFTASGASFRQRYSAWETMMQWVRSEFPGCTMRLTYPPLCYAATGADEDLFLARLCGFGETKTLFSSVLFLDKGLPSYDDSLRNAINQAGRHGLELREIEHMPAFYRMLEENKARYEQKPAHSCAELERLQRQLPRDARFFGAFSAGGDLHAGVYMLDCRRDARLFFYIASGESGRKSRAVPWLVDRMVRMAAADGIRVLDFGVSHETSDPNPMMPKTSLIHFKETFGATGALRTTLEIDLPA